MPLIANSFPSRHHYLLLIQHEISKASSTQGLNMFGMIFQDGAEIKNGCFLLTQQGITPGSLQQRVHCLPTLEIQHVTVMFNLLTVGNLVF